MQGKNKDQIVIILHTFYHIQESGCMYSFKTATDATRHMKIVHGAQGKAATPFGFVCRHLVNGEPCNLSFPTQAKMLKHKKKDNHFVPRPRGLKK